MKTELLEIRLPRRRFNEAQTKLTASEIDEAFASTTDVSLRVDSPLKANTDSNLAAGLRKQLSAMRQQCHELSRLINRLDG